ncbi:MAG: iron dependent repressor, metal binding and dimerization domain protein [Christensenellales bacterium]
MENNGFYTVRGYQLLQQNKRLLTSAMEDYLEMICRNSEKEGYLRINKLAELLHVQSSSATKMVQKLGLLGFLKYEKYGILILTEDGKELGKYLLNRHAVIECFLTTIGKGENPLAETELIEHNISTSTLKNIDILNKFFTKSPEILKSFERFKSTF